MKKNLAIGALLVIICMSSSLFASGVGLTGIGARATALGGNFRAVADDWSAMYWNPAGITQIQGMHFGMSFELIKPVGKYLFSQNSFPFSIYKTSEIENEPKLFPIPAAGFVYGGEKFAFGITFFAPFGLGAEWDSMDPNSYNNEYPDIEYEDDLKVIDVQPTFAVKVNDKLSLGVGLSVTYADIIIRKPTTTPNALIADPAYAQIKDYVLAPMGLTVPAYHHLLTEQQLQGDGLGFGFNFGIKYDVSEDLSVGLSAIYYNDIPLDGKLDAVTYYAKANQAIVQTQLTPTLDNMVAGGLLTSAQREQILDIYSGEKDVKYFQAEGDADLPLPMTVGAGFAYKGIDKLLVSADVSFTQWSSWDVIEIDIEDGNKSELVENWEDGIRFGAALEYQVSEPLAVRTSYYTEPSAIPDETLSITIPDPNRRHVFNIGASYGIGLIKLHASYEYMIIPDRDVDSWEYNAEALGFDNMAGTYKMTVHNFMMGIGINF